MALYAHYMAIAKAKESFPRCPHIRLLASERRNAKSISLVAELKPTQTGAIASELAAELYGLEILVSGIETCRENNHTRFLILDEKVKIPASEVGKSSICFTLPHKKGNLSQVLSVFAFYALNLTKISHCRCRAGSGDICFIQT